MHNKTGHNLLSDRAAFAKLAGDTAHPPAHVVAQQNKVQFTVKRAAFTKQLRDTTLH